LAAPLLTVSTSKRPSNPGFMTLSIIIVNYNVRFFLEQCLNSVLNSMKNIPAEVFVVDNTSVDGSVAMVREKFPWVKLIENQENVGFSKANNQAILQSSGKYILLLNPDTVLEEKTLEKVLGYMEQNPATGGLGVKMINGKGKFLPESKRGIPTPLTAFYKIFGLSLLFPKSEKFGKYHLSYLKTDEIHEVDVLSGAFMLLRRQTLDKIGLLDENFFMYGEDIDLSYRITLAGYKNIYYPLTTIIHYKGESTKKSSLNYVLTFYNAMLIFAQKHFASNNQKFFIGLIHTAIFIRGGLSILKRILFTIKYILLDFVLIFLGYLFLVPLWASLRPAIYPAEYQIFVVPAYALLWITSIYISGGYKKAVRLRNFIKGVGLGTILILTLYSLLSESYRFSRVLILLGAAWLMFAGLISRIGLYFFNKNWFSILDFEKHKIIVAGDYQHIEKVMDKIPALDAKHELTGWVGTNSNINPSGNYLGSIDKIEQVIKINRINDVYFCSQSLTATEIISYMHRLSRLEVDFKIISENGTIIGSNTIKQLGKS
jgi:O-antigen biosynthesis protein